MVWNTQCKVHIIIVKGNAKPERMIACYWRMGLMGDAAIEFCNIWSNYILVQFD